MMPAVLVSLRYVFYYIGMYNEMMMVERDISFQLQGDDERKYRCSRVREHSQDVLRFRFCRAGIRTG